MLRPYSNSKTDGVSPMTRTRMVLMGIILFPVMFWITGPFMLTGYWQAWPTLHNEAVVALTFDDGPNPVYTPQVLDILEAYNAKATFFVTGTSVSRHPEIARQIVTHGHEIANHSMHHEYKLPFLLPHQLFHDYRVTQDTIYNTTGVVPRLYRAPHGRISPWMGLILHRAGATIIGWDIWPKDLQGPAAEALVQRTLDQVKPGSIILLHDGLDLNQKANRDMVVQALPHLIEELQGLGYRFATVSELLQRRAASVPRGLPPVDYVD